MNSGEGLAAAVGTSTNGVHRNGRKNGSISERSQVMAARTRQSVASDVAPEVLAAPFMSISIEPVDVPMWPIHPAGWLQPEIPAAAPSWSGLNIERRNRIPAPGLLPLSLAPFDCPGKPDSSCDVLLPSAGPKRPESDLEPLGWDPRAICSQKELK
ncbi:MAG TPA: hypothetical protein VG675_07740 [Bryobacteraceae bacterium]|nr:hypothetical protein [Bryobacteraceae bacterium]